MSIMGHSMGGESHDALAALHQFQDAVLIANNRSRSAVPLPEEP